VYAAKDLSCAGRPAVTVILEAGKTGTYAERVIPGTATGTPICGSQLNPLVLVDFEPASQNSHMTTRLTAMAYSHSAAAHTDSFSACA
jgi:hypothetical protein